MTHGVSKTQILDVLEAVLHSWWTVVAGLCVGLAAASVALSLTDPVYETATKIFVAPQRVPEGYIRGTVDDDIAVRLLSLQEAVLSRPYMEKLIATAFSGEATVEGQERLMTKIRSKVLVTSRGSRYFQIQFQDTDPQRAAHVVNLLADLYIAENARFRVGRAGETSTTLQEIAEEKWVELQQTEKRVSDFRAKHLYTTPEQLESNLQLLSTRTRDLEVNDRAILDAEERLRLAQMQLEWAREPVSTDGTRPVTRTIEQLERELQDLRSRYSDSHPDVRNKQREIDAFLAAAPPAARDRVDAAPVNSPIELAVSSAEREIVRLRAQGERIRRDIVTYERRIDETPRVQQELDDLARGLSTLRDQYEGYLRNVEASEGALKLEENQMGSRFEVIERGTPPTIPITPKPTAYHGAGIALGLLLFVGPLLGRRLLSPLLLSEAGLREILGDGLFVSVPVIDNPRSKRRLRRMRLLNVGLSLLSILLLAAVMTLKPLV